MTVEYVNVETSSWHTEGLQCTNTDGVIAFTGGSAVFDAATFIYEPFEFDIESDAEVPLQYDVYLLRNSGVEVICTELGVDQFAFYDGDEEVLHCLMSIEVPPNAQVTNLTLRVRDVVNTQSQEEEPE